MSDNKHPDYITVYLPIAGWKAVLYCWGTYEPGGLLDLPAGMYEPWATSAFAFTTEEAAAEYAQQWAKDEGIEYRGPVFKDGVKVRGSRDTK